MRTGNPTLSEKTFQQVEQAVPGQGTMTVRGTVNKTALLFLILLLGASISWTQPSSLLIWGGAIGGFIVAMVTIFKKEWSPITAPVYAGLEVLILRGIPLTYAAASVRNVFIYLLLRLHVFAAIQCHILNIF